jgi:hypothetical protein
MQRNAATKPRRQSVHIVRIIENGEPVDLDLNEWDRRTQEFKDLPKNLRNLLIRNGYRTKQQVAAMSDATLSTGRLIGRKTLKAIRKYIPCKGHKMQICPNCQGTGVILGDKAG